MIIVHAVKDKYDVYVGRADSRIGVKNDSRLCNPFRKNTLLPKEWCVELFRSHARAQLKSRQWTRNLFQRLLGKRVACWCTDGICHAVVIKQLTDNSNLQSRSKWIDTSTYSKYVVMDSEQEFLAKPHSRISKFEDANKYPVDSVLYGLQADTVGYKNHKLFIVTETLVGKTWSVHPEYNIKL